MNKLLLKIVALLLLLSSSEIIFNCPTCFERAEIEAQYNKKGAGK